jgi:hypothetical protein
LSISTFENHIKHQKQCHAMQLIKILILFLNLTTELYAQNGNVTTSKDCSTDSASRADCESGSMGQKATRSPNRKSQFNNKKLKKSRANNPVPARKLKPNRDGPSPAQDGLPQRIDDKF